MEQTPQQALDFRQLLTETLPLAETFRRAGFRLYLVGGIVRDVLCGRQRPTLDIDLTTDALPDDIEALVRGLHPRALWLQGKRFGTVGATFVGPDGQDRAYEITTHRSDDYDARSRKPSVAFSTSIVADLSRRDFTINAIAMDAIARDASSFGADNPVLIDPVLINPVLIDPFGGADDLAANVLRTPVDPEISFTDDPLRMLRAARFVAGFSLVPVPALVSAAVALRDRLVIVSAERVRDEFVKLLLLDRPGRGLDFLADTGLLHEFFPELDGLVSDANLRARSSEALAASPMDEIVRLCVLFSVGVGDLAAEDRSRSAERRLRDLRCSLDVVDAVTALLEIRATFSMPTDVRSVREFVRTAGPHRSRFLRLIEVIGLGQPDQDGGPGTPGASNVADPDRAAHVAQLVADLEQAEGLVMAPALDGNAVMAHLHIGPGRDVGEAIGFLTELRLTRGVISETAAQAALDRWWSERRS